MSGLCSTWNQVVSRTPPEAALVRIGVSISTKLFVSKNSLMNLQTFALRRRLSLNPVSSQVNISEL